MLSAHVPLKVQAPRAVAAAEYLRAIAALQANCCGAHSTSEAAGTGPSEGAWVADWPAIRVRRQRLTPPASAITLGLGVSPSGNCSNADREPHRAGHGPPAAAAASSSGSNPLQSPLPGAHALRERSHFAMPHTMQRSRSSATTAHSKHSCVITPDSAVAAPRGTVGCDGSQAATGMPQVSCSAQQRGEPQLAKAATLEREASLTEVCVFLQSAALAP